MFSSDFDLSLEFLAMCEQRGSLRTVPVRDHVLGIDSQIHLLVLYNRENLTQVEENRKCICITNKNRKRQLHSARREVAQRGRLRTVLVRDHVLNTGSRFAL